MRFFREDNRTVRIRWYPVTLPVECLPFPSKINSLDWSSHPWLADGVGEVFGSDRDYNAAKALPYALGLTPCEPAEVFHLGETFDPDRPPQVYNEDQFPLCCLDIATAAGGVMFDGTATVTLISIVVLPIYGSCAFAITQPTFPLAMLGLYSCKASFPDNWTPIGLVPAGGFKLRCVSVPSPDAHLEFWSGCGSGSLFTMNNVGDTSPLLGTGGIAVDLVRGVLTGPIVPPQIVFEVLPP